MCNFKRVFIVVIFTIFIFSSISLAKSSFVKVGYGYSTNPIEEEAVKEAIGKLKKSLKKNPDFLILFSTVDYDLEKVLKEIRKKVGNKTKIYGGTSCLGVLTKDGFHKSEKGALAVLGVISDRIKFGVGCCDLDKFSPREAGKRAVIKAIKSAGKDINQKPKLILITSAPGSEEDILKGIAEIVGEDTPVIGGSSADNTIEGKWSQFCNDKVCKNSTVLAVIYTDLKTGISYQSGYERTIRTGVITKAEGRIIYEIDNKPAAEVYNEWLDGALSDVLKTGGKILRQTTFFPLAKVIRGRGDSWYFLSIHPLSFNLPEKSLSVFADVKTGDRIELMKGDWEMLLNRCFSTPRLALRGAKIKEEDVAFGIFTFCAGTMLAIPEEERDKMPLLVNKVLKGAPFIGTFTFGEQGYIPGIGNLHGNLVSSMVIISKKDE